MKKKVFLGLLLGALSFGSCVKDNESDAVKKQRDAQAELTLAQAKVKNSEAEVQAAEAKIKVAKAELESQLIKSKVETATASSTIAKANAEKEVEEKRLQKEKILAKFQAELDLAKAKAENIKAEAEGLKINNLGNLIASVTSATTLYSNAVSAVTSKEDEISKLEVRIAEVKADVVSATEYVAREKAAKQAEIEGQKLELKAYEDMVASDFGTINDIKAKLKKKENEANVAKIAFNNKFDKVKAMVADGTSYKESLDKLSGKELAKLTFFENLKKVFDLTKAAADGITSSGYLSSSDAESFAGKIAKRTNYLTSTTVYLLLEDDGNRPFTKKTSPSVSKTYELYKGKYSDDAKLQAGFFDDTYVEAAEGYFDLKVNDAKSEQTKAKNKEAEAKAASVAATTSATTNTDTTQQAALDATAQQKKKEYAEAKAKKKEADEKVTDAENNKKAFQAAIAEVKKAANKKELLDLVTKFIKEQNALKTDGLDKLKDLEDKYNEVNDEKTALENTVKNVAQVINNGNNADDIANKIKDLKKDIADNEHKLATYSEVKTAEDVVKMEEAKLERYKKELDLLNKKLDAARTAYQAAIEALKKATA